jgi:hypothetical protein
MPFFNNLPSRATYRLLITFFLITSFPLVFYFLLVAINADLPGDTSIDNPLTIKIPIIVVTSLWILYVASGAPRRRDWPLTNWTDAADLCMYMCPLMLVLLVCFCLSAFVPNADLVPENQDGIGMPASMIPLFGLAAIGLCVTCCSFGRNPENCLGHCWLGSLSLALFFFVMFLGFKTSNIMETVEVNGQAALVETKYTWFSTFFPTFLIDIAVFPCAVGRFSTTWKERNVDETHTARCTGWFLFCSVWLSTLVVRYLFVYDESNLMESWNLLPGGVTFQNGSSVNGGGDQPHSIINSHFGQHVFNQLTMFGSNDQILPEHVDGEFIRCVSYY